MTIKNLSFEDNGSSFIVKLKNSLGEVISNKSVVSVFCPPKFVHEPQSKKVLIDKEAKFECSFRSNPAPNVIWYLNEKELTQKDGVKIEKNTSKNQYSIIFPKVSSTNIGTITVKATNEYGTVEKSCLLEKLEAPKILNKLDNQTVDENNEVLFKINFTGIPKPSVKWFKDNIEIQPNNVIEIKESDDESILILKSCYSKEHSGSYFVKLSNDFGTVESNKALLTINSTIFINFFLPIFKLFLNRNT